ncbi:asparagine synthase-related protein [Novosphingobium aquae]|uniref:asparagine synthase (glutamine-hydrolyzing) n=1 Tax=Novosphingobium aquae TaxID=3133435 RepID=A0ABU8SDY6_9SPHN
MSFLIGFSPTSRCDPHGVKLDAANSQALMRGEVCCGKFWRFGELSTSAKLELAPHRSMVLIGRVRLDRRTLLIARLRGDLPSDGRSLTDADLCLWAYVRWGEGMVEQIQGDFSFAIWDSGPGKLFCARDHLGIRPFAYFQYQDTWWIADSMQLLSHAPGYWSGEINKAWIRHFLRYGGSEPATSVYSHVHRLLPAHTLTLTGNAITVRRYWAFQIGEPLILRPQEQYQEQFEELLTTAVRDRMPQGRVGISMSGGIDSPALAAKAVQIAGTPDRVVAHTTVLHGERDPEWEPSRLVARHLGIEQHMVESASLMYEPAWQQSSCRFAEPNMEVTFPEALMHQRQAMREMSSVWFAGEGPDNAMTFEWRSYLNWLAGNHMWRELSLASCRYVTSKSLSEWKGTVGRMLFPVLPHISRSEPVNSSLEQDDDWSSPEGEQPLPSWRPQADLTWRAQYLWTRYFEGLDFMHDSYGIEWRHPFMDLELRDFMLRTPPIPWAREKRLLRQTMKGRLPRRVLNRPKSVGQIDVFAQTILANPPKLPGKGSLVGEFISPGALSQATIDLGDSNWLLRLAVVDHWLAGRLQA